MPLNAVDHGCDPSGVKDSTEALRTLLNSIRGGDVSANAVYVPNGIYSLGGIILGDPEAIQEVKKAVSESLQLSDDVTIETEAPEAKESSVDGPAAIEDVIDRIVGRTEEDDE